MMQRKAKLQAALQDPSGNAVKQFFAQHPKARARFAAQLGQPNGMAQLASKVGPQNAMKIADAVNGQQKPVPIT